MPISVPARTSCFLFRHCSSDCLSQICIWRAVRMCFVLKPLCLILADCSFYNANGRRLVSDFPSVSWSLPPGGTSLNEGWWFTKQNSFNIRVWYVVLWPLWVSCVWCCLNSFLGCITVEKYNLLNTSSIPHYRLHFLSLACS